MEEEEEEEEEKKAGRGVKRTAGAHKEREPFKRRATADDAILIELRARVSAAEEGKAVALTTAVAATGKLIEDLQLQRQKQETLMQTQLQQAQQQM